MKPLQTTNDFYKYYFLNFHRVSINILPYLYFFLLEFSGIYYPNTQHGISEIMKYLYKKYHKKILRIKIGPNKKTATSEYQPKTKNYNIQTIYITPYIWDKYWDLRRVTGYSISYIIRIFLEWELEELTIQNSRLVTIKNQIEEYKRKLPMDIIKSNEHLLPLNYFFNSYALFKLGISERNEVYVIFKDIFW